MHTHSFKNTGGGCMVVGNEKYPCDITYECACGERFELRTTVSGYTALPTSFSGANQDEAHQASVDAINDAIINPDGGIPSNPESEPLI